MKFDRSLPGQQTRLKYRYWYAIAALGILAAGCGGGGSAEPACSTADVAAVESEMDVRLAQADSEVPFSFAVDSRNGRRYTYSRGASSLRTFYESASTSKLVSSVIIMRLVEQDYLSLDDRPQDYIAGWPIGSSNSLYPMNLAHLMSFTSGLTQEPACLHDAFADFESCIIEVANINAGNGLTPGTQFYYSASDQQVAGMMAIEARGVASWQDIFAEFQAQTGLFPTATFNVTSQSNPRIAGGMNFIGEEYLAFLKALKDGRLLNGASMSQLLADRTAGIPIVYSPFQTGIGGGPGLGEDWHFGFGLAHECQSATYNCVAGSRISSPGAFGSYPFWDRSKNYTGVVVRRGEFGTLVKGINIERAVRPLVEKWAAC